MKANQTMIDYHTKAVLDGVNDFFSAFDTMRLTKLFSEVSYYLSYPDDIKESHKELLNATASMMEILSYISVIERHNGDLGASKKNAMQEGGVI
jgi:hypothetical protein